MSALKLVGLFAIGLLSVIGLNWLLHFLSGDRYQFPDGWILGFAIGLATVIGARLRARTNGGAR